MDQNPQYYPVAGQELLENNNILNVFPEAHRKSSKFMSLDTANDLRNWLIEPEFNAEQRRSLDLNSEQINLITTRTKSGYRKIKGPAGSGKSLVLAARAAQLASEGKLVLVITFNITLLNYLMDLSVRWTNYNRRMREQVTWLNFHYWCKRVCYETFHRKEYRELWMGVNDQFEIDVLEGTKKDSSIANILSEQLPSLVNKILDGPNQNYTLKYDAILVDEGQDLRLEWWNCLRKVLKDNGEMVLVADTTQDIYETTKYWTDEKMNGSGLVGSWTNLPISYRLPEQMIAKASQFAKDYLPEGLIDIPKSPPDQGDFFTKLRWVQTKPLKAISVICEEITKLAPSADPNHLAMSDIVFLSADNNTGLEVINILEKKNIKFLHTFTNDSEQGRRLKLAFYKGDSRLKATTMHSFKGWESKSLIIYTGEKWETKTKALIYTGMTRLKKSMEGSFITIVSSINELAEFGKTWPNYQEIY